MLERLDDVDWSQLTHAYGAATDTPRWIRALASGKPNQQEDPLCHLGGSIAHQGSCYDATVEAVPFLIEVLEHVAHAQVDLLNLLGWLVTEPGDYWEARDTRLAVVAGTPVYLRLLADPRPNCGRQPPSSWRPAWNFWT